MLEIIGEAVGEELAFNAVSGSPGACPLRIAALYHEARDHPVENKAVIESLVDQGYEVIDRIGRNLGVQFGFDDAAVLHFEGYYRVAGALRRLTRRTAVLCGGCRGRGSRRPAGSPGLAAAACHQHEQSQSQKRPNGK
ncbi:hypothetical protein D3C73_1268420 [compost metagenome]